jgi:hypothetical protein
VPRDPASHGIEGLIRRERVDGYEASFWTPERERVECNVGLYRSNGAARKVFPLRAVRFAAFVVATRKGRPASVPRLGAETRALRFDSTGLAVLWRYRRVLASCAAITLDPGGRTRLLLVAQAQQRRFADVLG